MIESCFFYNSLEHLSEMRLDLYNPLRKAAFFGAIFNKVPTYAEIDLRIHENSPLPEVNELFKLRKAYKSTFGDPGGSRTRDFLDENQTSWTTRRRDRKWCVHTLSKQRWIVQ